MSTNSEPLIEGKDFFFGVPTFKNKASFDHFLPPAKAGLNSMFPEYGSSLSFSHLLLIAKATNNDLIKTIRAVYLLFRPAGAYSDQFTLR